MYRFSNRMCQLLNLLCQIWRIHIFSLPWLNLHPCITETGCLGHTESWYIHLSVCSVKGQVYTLQAQRKGSLCLSFSLSNPTSLILDSRVQTHIVSPNMSVARQTHTYCILYERTKSQSVSHLKCTSCLREYFQFVMLVGPRSIYNTECC